MGTDFLDYCNKNIIGNNIYIYGAGNNGQIIAEYLNASGVHVQGFIDTDLNKIGKQYCCRNVFSVNDVQKKRIKVLISVSPLYSGAVCNNIFSNLLSVGIDSNDIIRVSENSLWMKEIIFFLKKPREILKRNMTLKKIYKGQRCFLIGNGPSLRIDDLEMLKKEYTFGCNGLYQLFDKTEWRPTGYIFSDPILINKYILGENSVRYLSKNCKYIFTSINNHIYDDCKYMFDNLYFFYLKTEKEKIFVSEEIENEIFEGGTSLFALIQIIFYMGFSEIFLLGVDFDFSKIIDSKGNIFVDEKKRNHAQGIDDNENAKYDVCQILRSWDCAKEYADSNGVKIYNATRGGKLEVFKRVKFEALFDENKL